MPDDSYRREGVSNLNYIREISKKNSDKVFLIDSFSESQWTYASFYERAEQVAEYLLRSKLDFGDRIAVVLDNSADCCFLYFGAMLARITLIPINPGNTKEQIAHILRDSRAKLVFTSPELRKTKFDEHSSISVLSITKAEDQMTDSVCLASLASSHSKLAIEGSDDFDAIIIYTSGTTAEPKGIVHTLKSLTENAKMFNGELGLDSNCRFINYLPITYLGGYYNLLVLPYIAEGSTVIAEVFNAQSALRYWETVIRHEVNTLWFVPTIINILLELDRGEAGEKYCREKIKAALVGTAPLSAETRTKFEVRYGIKLKQNFALSETLFLTSQTAVDQASDCGKVLPQIEIRLIDKNGYVAPPGEEGEIEVKTPFLMKGYFNSESGQADVLNKNDWFATGDLGTFTTKGSLQVTGRKKDLIIKGGINISPAVIEKSILKSSHVMEVAVVGIPERYMGEEVVAVLRLIPDSDFSQVKAELQAICKAELSSVQQPSVYLELPEFPKTASSKIQKSKIRLWAKERVNEERQKRVTPQLQSAASFAPSKVVGDGIEAMSIRYNTMVYEKKRNGEDVTVLSLGEAFFDIPLFRFDDLPFPDIYHYSHSRGVPELRERLAEYFLDHYDVPFDPEREIIVTAGSKIAIYMALKAVIDPGDEVLIHDPAWVSYPEQVKYCHGVPVCIPYDVSVYDFERYITKRTKVIIINNPNNPRGNVFSLGELSFLYSLAQKHNLFILSDEAYSDFVLDQDQFVSIGNLDREKRHLILVNSISKNYGISGWRLGYVISNPQLIDQILKLNQHLITCPATILEYYIAKHFSEIIQITKPQIRKVVELRKEVADYADSIGLEHLPGSATFYLFVSIKGSKLSSEEFCTKLLQERLISVVPGIGYGKSCDQFVRVSIGTESLDRIKRGLDEVKNLIQESSDSALSSKKSNRMLQQAGRGCEILVKTCANLQPGNAALIITDYSTKDLGVLLSNYARQITSSVSHTTIKTFKIHGQEPPTDVAEQMMRADVIFGMTKMSLAHSKARYEAMRNGASYLSLPDYSWEVLASPALHADFYGLTNQVVALSNLFTSSSELLITNPAGTSLKCRVDGRIGNAAPGWCGPHGKLASPPDIEANISPIEGSAEGIIIVDGSIPCLEIGLLQKPIALTIRQGAIVSMEGERADILQLVFDRGGDVKSRLLAEVGVGMNGQAQLVGRMLEDEGCAGTMHFGFGSNVTIGGQNSVPFHLDCVIRDAVLIADGKTVWKNGTRN